MARSYSLYFAYFVSVYRTSIHWMPACQEECSFSIGLQYQVVIRVIEHLVEFILFTFHGIILFILPQNIDYCFC